MLNQYAATSTKEVDAAAYGLFECLATKNKSSRQYLLL